MPGELCLALLFGSTIVLEGSVVQNTSSPVVFCRLEQVAGCDGKFGNIRHH